MILYSVSLLVLLFFRPNDQNYHSWNLIPFSTIGFYLSGNVNWLISFYNLAANIGLFIPFGIFLMVNTSRSPMKLFLFPMMAIALIEVLQLLTHRGSLDIDDLILNMLGIIVGYLFYPVFKRIVSIQR
jgi:glycopeptide antibiotics resistance protein